MIRGVLDQGLSNVKVRSCGQADQREASATTWLELLMLAIVLGVLDLLMS